MAMKLKFHGVRGSRPVQKPGLIGYGGHSTSLEFIIDESFYLFLDGGTGLCERGRELGEHPEKNQFHFLMTHTHWDHVIGFPFFAPFYSSENQITFYSSTTSRSTFNQLFWGLHRADNLPVPVSKLKAKINFQEIQPSHAFTIGKDVRINTFQLNHQGVTLGYRIEQGDSSVCVITDHAPIENGNYLGENMPKGGVDKEFEVRFNQAMVDFLKGAHTVVFDTHFNEENLKPDWGHSSPAKAFDLCERAGISRLVIFHHAPEDQDDAVDAKVRSIAAMAKKSGIEVVAAKEGDVWDLKCA